MKKIIKLLILMIGISNIHSLNDTHKNYDKDLNNIKLQYHTVNEKPQEPSKLGVQNHIELKSTPLNNLSQSLSNSLKNNSLKADIFHKNDTQIHNKQKIPKHQANKGHSKPYKTQGQSKPENHVKDIKRGHADKQKESQHLLHPGLNQHSGNTQHHVTEKQNEISLGSGKRQIVSNKVNNQFHVIKSSQDQNKKLTTKYKKLRPDGKTKPSKDLKKSLDKKKSLSNPLNNKPNSSTYNSGKENSIKRDNKNMKGKVLSKSSKRNEKRPAKSSKPIIKKKKLTYPNDLKQPKKQISIQYGQNNNVTTNKPNVKKQAKTQKNISKKNSNIYVKKLATKKLNPYSKFSKNNHKNKVEELNKKNYKRIQPSNTQTKKSVTRYIGPVFNQTQTPSPKKHSHLNSSKVVTEHEFPYMAAVFKGQEYLSAGALIDEQWVLTVADKLYSTQGSIYFLRVRLGSINHKKGGQLLSVKFLEIHPYYHSSKPTYDLAMIKLSEPVRYSGNLRSVRLQLVPKEVTVSHFIVTSWAERSVKSKPSLIEPILSVAHLHPSDPEECVEELNEISASSDGVMCLDTEVDNPCRRDVGAPVVTNGLLWGLVSSWKPPNCEEEDNVTFVSTMSAKNVTNWVHATIHGHTMESES